jgi:murein DD-endopeptidase MepM/ murein hydrolase activator NlpD
MMGYPSWASTYIPGDDKKAKAKGQDTVCARISCDPETDLPDTLSVPFPCHDLYTSWDVNTAHPYNFDEAFNTDSVSITLVKPGENNFSMPFRGNLTSLFGWRRYLPHYGTDIDLETGDSVLSAFDGMVRLAKYVHGYGNCVIVRHHNGLETVYAHLSRLLAEPGQSVRAGELLGLGGNTGRSTGSHLHFEIRYLGQAIDTQDLIDFEQGSLRSNLFVLRKSDVENKYDLRTLHNRHRTDVFYVKTASGISQGYYIIRKGDTLGAIARKCGTNVKQLCRKNNLRQLTVLRVGQKIKF